MAFQIFMFLNNLKPLFLLSIILVLLQSCSCANSSFSCRQEERDALIRFGRIITTDTEFFNSSVSLEQGQDCCDWSWITCDAVTRHVVKIELYPSDETQVSPFPPVVFFATKLDISSLLQLKFLNHLDLRGLFFNGPDCQIPEFIGSMKRLKFLDLSWTSFCVRVPPHLGNLTNLEFLSLGGYDQLSLGEARWISHLVSLKHLELSVMWVEEGARNDLINSLLQLKFLNHLDLRGLYFNGPNCQIPEIIGSMKSLKYLDLSGTNFCGRVPPHLGNLTNLEFLSLGCEYGDGQLSLDEPRWISHLVSLKHFDLRYMKVEEGARNDLITALRALPSLSYLDLISLSNVHLFDDIMFNSTFYFPRLQHLDLSGNGLQGKIPIAIQNMTSLTYLDMSDNQFNSSDPSWFGGFANLQHLDLSWNNFESGFPSSLPANLKELDLSRNQLSGIIPSSLGNLSVLRMLSLSHNQLSGMIPSSLGNLSVLRRLDLSYNQLSGIIPSSLGNLSVLRMLDLSENHLTGNIPSSLGRLLSLTTLILRNNHFNGGINIGQLSRLEVLDISLNNLSTPIPYDIVRNMTQLRSLFLSHNLITGTIPTSLCDMFLLEEIDLADNKLTGSIPNCGRHIVSSTLWKLDLSNNRIFGDIPEDIGTNLPNLNHLLLNDNLMSGSIPPSLCDMFHLEELNLSNNTLTRNIPDCWWESSSLAVINLSSNKLTGVIPSSIMNISGLWSLHLNKNNLHGELPEALGFLRSLVILDLGENNLSSDVPLCIGESLLSLKILRLRDNKLNGVIPRQLCGLSGLQILDLAGNDLDGEIPSCFSFIHGMSDVLYPSSDIDSLIPSAAQPSPLPSDDWSKEKMTEVLKGSEMEYTKNLKYVITLDLSRNKLIGSIPEDLTLLNRLDCLNLSYNALSGPIPEKIGSLNLLESLDLSNNQLSGTIPQSISDLSFLNHLNMANNRLSGRIPKGNQLDTVYDFDHSIYDGNPQLCGEPLPKLCPGDKLTPLSPYMPRKHDEDDQDVLEQTMFYVVVMLGFGTGFWGVVGTLMFMKSWRAAYFKFADDIVDKVYVVVKVKVAKLKRSRRRSMG